MKTLNLVLIALLISTCAPVYAAQIYTFNNTSSATVPTTANVLIQKMTQGLSKDTNSKDQQAFVWDSTDNLIVNGHTVKYADGTPITAGYAAVGPIRIISTTSDLTIRKGSETNFWVIFTSTPETILVR